MQPNLPSMIQSRLSSYGPLADLLSHYSGQPAVFYQTSPADQQSGWNGLSQYPRIVFDLDEQANAERKSSGTLVAIIYADRDGTEPERIEPLVKSRLKDLLVKPEGSFPYCFAWARTDAFELESKGGGVTNRRIIGLEVRFDIVEYPAQETTDPDPIAALNAFLLDAFPELTVLGLSKMEEFTETDAGHPAVYCRLQSERTVEITNTVVWMDATIAIHVICSDAEARLKITADISNLITWAAEIIMLDGSPMRPLRMELNNTADYLKEGQLNGVFHYGVLRWMAKPHRIMNANTDVQAHDQL